VTTGGASGVHGAVRRGPVRSIGQTEVHGELHANGMSRTRMALPNCWQSATFDFSLPYAERARGADLPRGRRIAFVRRGRTGRTARDAWTSPPPPALQRAGPAAQRVLTSMLAGASSSDVQREADQPNPVTVDRRQTILHDNPTLDIPQQSAPSACTSAAAASTSTPTRPLRPDRQEAARDAQRGRRQRPRRPRRCRSLSPHGN
jgi:hypothetical protein